MTVRYNHNQKKSVYFDGSTNYLKATAGSAGKANLNPQGDEAFSITMWVLPQRAAGTREFLYTKAHNSSPYDGIYFEFTAAKELKFSFYTNSSGTANGINVPSFVNVTRDIKDGWNMIGCSYDGSEAVSGGKVYLNGVDVSVTGSATGTPANMSAGTTATPHEAMIGALYGASSNRFLGSVCAVAFWQTALTAAQMEEVYLGAGTRPGPGDLTYHSEYANLVSWWISDHASDSTSTINDSKGSFNMTGVGLDAGSLYPVNI